MTEYFTNLMILSASSDEDEMPNNAKAQWGALLGGGSQSSHQSNTLAGVSAMELVLSATQKFKGRVPDYLKTHNKSVGNMSILWFKKMATQADWKTLLGDGPLAKKQLIVKVLHTLICERLVAAFEDATGTIPKKLKKDQTSGLFMGFVLLFYFDHVTEFFTNLMMV